MELLNDYFVSLKEHIGNRPIITPHFFAYLMSVTHSTRSRKLQMFVVSGELLNRSHIQMSDVHHGSSYRD
jgi:hypothetical protein